MFLKKRGIDKGKAKYLKLLTFVPFRIHNYLFHIASTHEVLLLQNFRN